VSVRVPSAKGIFSRFSLVYYLFQIVVSRHGKKLWVAFWRLDLIVDLLQS
jgi:hypothetical protein